MAYGGLSFPCGHCLSCTACLYFYASDMTNVSDTGSTLIYLSWMFLPTVILFWTTYWITYNGPPLYQFYKINLGQSAGKFQLALQPFFRRLRPWMNHLPPVWWSTFGSVFCKVTFGVQFWHSWKDFFYQFLVLVCLSITQVWPVVFALSLFYSEMTFYIRNLVLPYSIDVVLTLSCYMYGTLRKNVHFTVK